MAFDKMIPSVISEYEIYETDSGDELQKAASTHVDLPDGFIFDPDYLYLWVRIVSAGEYYGPNKNGDYFPEEELLAFYETFKNGHAFKNHENKKVEQAIGEIINVRWNPIMKCVEIFKGIDKKRAPEIARGFTKGYLTDVSMGCKVPYTVCSVCGNKARRRNEFCDHVNKYRNQYLGNGERVFEINYEPNFHDSSAVLTGAERVAKAFVIIDSPPTGAKVAFKKTASVNGVSRYIKLSDQEIDKVAAHRTIHPLLMDAPIEKQASDHLFLQKIAELEKEVTGKLLNIVSAPESEKVESAGQMLEIIKFLTEKRLDEETLTSIGQTIRQLASSEGVSVQRAFSVLLGVAELMGIEFFPGELHTLLSAVTDAGLNPDLELSNGSGKDLYPSEFAKGIKRTLEATKQLPEFEDSGSLVEMYDEGAHLTDMLRSDPFGFVESMKDSDDFEQRAPTKVVKIIRQTLTPIMSARSHHAEHLLPRLTVVLSGHKPIIGGVEARRDFDMLANPQTLGDMLATFAYRNYQQMRPAIVQTKLMKLAMHDDTQLEKVASDELPYQGIKRRHLALTAFPLMYGLSLFQQNRREHGRNLSDVENFVADHPGVITSGLVLAGKPLSREIGRMGIQASGKARQLGTELNTKFEDIKGKFEKESSPYEFEALTKIADCIHTSSFNVFEEPLLVKFANESGLNAQEVAALKIASILSVAGLEKEANEIMDFYQLPDQAKGMFLKCAAEETRNEIEKAANDYLNNFLLDSVIDQRSMSATLPGRLVDAFIMTKITDKLKQANQPKPPEVPTVQQPQTN